jgi:hypothetical protein
MKGTMSLKRKGSNKDHPVDRLFGRLTLGGPVDEIVDQMQGPRPAHRGKKASAPSQ